MDVNPAGSSMSAATQEHFDQDLQQLWDAFPEVLVGETAGECARGLRGPSLSDDGSSAVHVKHLPGALTDERIEKAEVKHFHLALGDEEEAVPSLC